MDGNNRLVIFGGSLNGGPAYIARFTEAGARDTSFNQTGVVNYSNPRGNSTNCFGALQSGNRPVIACTVARDVSIARFTEAGVLDTTFGATQPDSDTVPDAFSFAPVTVPYGTIYVNSAPVTITGFDAGVSLRVFASSSNGVSVGCDVYRVGEPVFITAGQTLCVRIDASTTPGGTATADVSIGGVSSQFVVQSTNTAADTTPEPFTFTAQTNVPVSAVVNSNTITISGITGHATATATGGYLSVGCTPDAEAFTRNRIENGTQICLRMQAADTPGTAKSMTLNVGGVVATFTVTTAAVATDTTPDPFSFTSQTNVPVSAVVNSNIITISGIDGFTTATATGGYLSINCATDAEAFVNDRIQNGTQLCLRMQAAATAGTERSMTLNVGGVIATFTTTTATASSGGGSSSGGGGSGSSDGGGGGSLDLLLLAFLSLSLAMATRQRLRPRGHACADVADLPW